MHTEDDFLSQDEIALLKRTALKGFTEDQQASFIRICQRTRLDPFQKQIYATRRMNQGVPQLVTVTAVLGLTSIAERTGTYDGCELFWAGQDGEWKREWLQNENPIAAKAIVYHKLHKFPEVGIARWNAYAGPSDFWRRMPDHMLAKCAKALALRGAYPDQMTGLYASEELDGGVSDSVTSESDRLADIQQREAKAQSKLAKEPGVRIVASSGGRKPTPEEAAEEAFLTEEEPPPVATAPPTTAPAAASPLKQEAESTESQEGDDLDMEPSASPPQETSWKTHVVSGLKHKNYFGKQIGELTPAEMAVIENQWLPAIKAQWDKANEHQRTDAQMFEAAIAHQKTIKPW